MSTFFKPAIRPALRSAVRSALSDSLSSIQRHFTFFDSVAQSYVGFNTINLTGDFEIEFYAQIPDDGAYYFSNRNSSSNSDRFGVARTTPLFGLATSNNYQSNITIPFGDLKIHKWNIKRVGTTLTVTLDGDKSDAAGGQSTGTVSLNSIGAPYAGNTSIPNMQGIISDFKVWAGGDRNSGTLVLDMRLNLDYTPDSPSVENIADPNNNGTFANVASGDSLIYSQKGNDIWFGPNLITQEVWEYPDSVHPAWIYNASDNTWSLDGDGSYQELRLLQGDAYQFPIKLEGAVNSLSGNLIAADSGADAVITEVGPYSLKLDDSNSIQLYKRNSGAMAVTLSRPSLRSMFEVVKSRRHFTVFDSVAQSYIGFNTINLTGDFEIEFYAQIPDDGAYYFSNRNSSSNSDRFGVARTTPLFGLATSNNYQSNITIPFGDLKIHKWNIKRVGTTLTVTLDNSSSAVGSSSATISFNSLGSPYAGATSVPYMQGIIAGFKVWNGGDKHTGTLVMDMPINGYYEPSNAIVENAAIGSDGTFANVADGDSKLYINVDNVWLDESNQELKGWVW